MHDRAFNVSALDFAIVFDHSNTLAIIMLLCTLFVQTHSIRVSYTYYNTIARIRTRQKPQLSIVETVS